MSHSRVIHWGGAGTGTGKGMCEGCSVRARGRERGWVPGTWRPRQGGPGSGAGSALSRTGGADVPCPERAVRVSQLSQLILSPGCISATCPGRGSGGPGHSHPAFCSNPCQKRNRELLPLQMQACQRPGLLIKISGLLGFEQNRRRQ